MQQQFAHLSDPHLTTLENVGYGQLMSKRLLEFFWQAYMGQVAGNKQLIALIVDQVSR